MPLDHPRFHDLVCFNFYVGWRHIQAIYRQAFPDGVNPQRAYLLCACDPAQATPVASLLDALELDSPAMSGLLARLQAEGLLRREVNPDDRREVLVRLTPAGVQLRQDTIQRLQAADRLLAQHIDRDDLDRLRRVVARLGDLA
jgi:MarR family transcriptional regulator, organic hydroperoxide resistance regulator